MSRARVPGYHSWANMIARCVNPRTPKFAYYGGREGQAAVNKWLFRGLTAMLVVAAAVIWGQILTAKAEVAAEAAAGPYGPPEPGAYTFAASYLVCSPDYVATVVSARGGNRIVCAPLNREKQ